MEMTNRQIQIIDQAVRIIAEQGIHKLTVKNLAKALDFSEPALYRHFDNKQAILYAIINRFHEISEAMRQQVDETHKTGLDKVEAFLQQRFIMFANNPHLTRVMLNEGNFAEYAGLARKVLEVMHRHQAIVREGLNEAMQQGVIARTPDLMNLFLIIAGSTRLLVTRWLLMDGGFSLPDEGESLWNTLRTLLICNKQEKQ